MNTLECIKTRRSIREYNAKPVDRQLIEQAIDAASFSPSWKNTQVTRYIVIDDEAVKAKIDRMHRMNLHKLLPMPGYGKE